MHLTHKNHEFVCVTKGNVKSDSNNDAVVDSFMYLDKFYGLILETFALTWICSSYNHPDSAGLCKRCVFISCPHVGRCLEDSEETFVRTLTKTWKVLMVKYKRRSLHGSQKGYTFLFSKKKLFKEKTTSKNISNYYIVSTAQGKDQKSKKCQGQFCQLSHKLTCYRSLTKASHSWACQLMILQMLLWSNTLWLNSAGFFFLNQSNHLFLPINLTHPFFKKFLLNRLYIYVMAQLPLSADAPSNLKYVFKGKKWMMMKNSKNLKILNNENYVKPR